MITYKEVVVELFSSEDNSFLEGGGGEELRNLVASRRVGHRSSKVCGGPDDDGRLSNCKQPSAERGQAPSNLGLTGGAR